MQHENLQWLIAPYHGGCGVPRVMQSVPHVGVPQELLPVLRIGPLIQNLTGRVSE